MGLVGSNPMCDTALKTYVFFLEYSNFKLLNQVAKPLVVSKAIQSERCTPIPFLIA